MANAKASSSGPTPASDDTLSLRPLYEESSQFRHWRFSELQLARMRQELNERAVAVVKKNMEAEKAAAASLPSSGASTPLDSSATATPSASGSSKPLLLATIDISAIPYLSVEDEQALIRYYLGTVARTCAGFGLPEVVEATCVSYVKRFYLWNTCMDYHPRKIMPTCLFLACKTENCLIPLDTFVARFAKLPSADVLQLEFLVAQALRFEFTVWHAFKALRGFGLDMQSLPDVSSTTLQETLRQAHTHLTAASSSDLELIYTASQLALGAIHFASSDGQLLVASYLADKAAKGLKGAEEEVKRTIEEVASRLKDIVEGGKGAVDMERVKEVDRRLRLCSNPEKVVGSALYLKRKAEEEVEEARHLMEKQKRARAQAEADAAVFGGNLVIPQTEEGTRAEMFGETGVEGGGGRAAPPITVDSDDD